MLTVLITVRPHPGGLRSVWHRMHDEMGSQMAVYSEDHLFTYSDDPSLSSSATSIDATSCCNRRNEGKT
jgi:hypothetical protein